MNNTKATFSNFLLLAAEWNTERNGIFPTTTQNLDLQKKVNWHCNTCGKEWQMSIDSRLQGSGCPYCLRRRAKTRKTLADVYPELAAEFHPTKNKGLTASDFTCGSGQKAWWICDKGHEYETSIFTRTRGSKCPICAGKKVLAGFNDLATTHPQLIFEWRSQQDDDITPQSVSHATRKKAWWICSTCGHEWKANIADRAKGSHCPECSRNKPHCSRNSIINTHPFLLKEWHPTKNGEVKPYHVGRTSKRMIWWICVDDHVWQDEARKRARGAGCPECPDGRALNKKEFREVTRERISKEWHPEKNYVCSMENACLKASDKVWWLCEKGHEWEAKLSSRMNGANCPYCTGWLATPETSLLGVNPTLAAELHPTKNTHWNAETLIAQSTHKVWWQCSECNYEWEAVVNIRMAGACGCPKCKVQKRIPLSPTLLKQWHPTKNTHIDLDMVSAGSNKKAWWICDKGHEWESLISGRSQGNGCPFCSGRYKTRKKNKSTTQ